MATHRSQEPLNIVSAQLMGQQVAVYYYHHDACLSVRELHDDDFGVTVMRGLLARVPAIVLDKPFPVVSDKGYATWRAKQTIRPGRAANYLYAHLRGQVVRVDAADPPSSAVPVALNPAVRPDFHCPQTGRSFISAERAFVAGKKIWADAPQWKEA